MATVKDLRDYYSRLEQAFDRDEPSLDYNDDRAHNTMVMRLMFEKATSIYMYCGELSVLRSGFKDHVSNEINDGEDLVNEMLDSLDVFLRKENTSLNIVFENYKDNYLEDLCRKGSFLKGLADGKISICSLSDEFTLKRDLSHFAFTDNKITRVEQDKVKHCAICSFKNDDVYTQVKSNFSKLQAIASPINPIT